MFPVMLITEKSPVGILAYSLPYGGLRPGPSGECTDSGYFVETLLRSSPRSLRPPRHRSVHSKHQRGRKSVWIPTDLLRLNVLVHGGRFRDVINSGSVGVCDPASVRPIK